MPKSSKRVYDSDDGFVEDGRKSKKQRSEPKSRNTEMQKDKDGVFWELSGKRRVQVSEFKGNTMIGIREFYEKDGEMLPGKKGISMTVEQYTAFIDLMPGIEGVLKSKGIKAPRPQYDKISSSKEAEDRDDEEEEQEEEGVEEDEEEEEEQKRSSSKHKGKLEKYKMKKNHEATSDEDEG